MNTNLSKTEIIDLIKDKTKGTHIASLITVNSENIPCARPMATQEISPEGVITFMTDKNSKKIHEIKNVSTVTLSYTPGNDITFVNLTGDATVREDREKIKELWSSFHEAWFEGPDDPRITLIEVTVDRLEYWDYAGGKVGAYFDMALSAVAGTKAKGGENETLILK